MFNQFALMLTRRCNMACAHCSVESNPKLATGPDQAVLEERLRQAAASGMTAVLLTGGEPMLREPVVMHLLGVARDLGMTATMSTNGFWGRTPERARKTVAALQRGGIVSLNLSYDRYHREFMGPEPLLNIARAAQEVSLTSALVVTHTREENELEGLIAPFREIPGLSFRFYDVQPVGAARNFDRDTLSGRTDGFCQACQLPTVTDDGRVTACNGPGYFQPLHSPLQVGNVAEEDLATLLQRHQSDPILETIRTFGPERLLHELRDSDFQPRPHYTGMCDLCTHICGDQQAVGFLQERLSTSAQEASRVAAAMVISRARRHGCLGREAVNSVGIAGVLLGRLRGVPSPNEDTVLSRHDLDWIRVAQVVAESSLLRATFEALSEVRSWVPEFVRERLSSQSIGEALREMRLRQALEQVDSALQALHLRGVVLKGGDLMLQGARRCGGDIDLWVEGTGAGRLYQYLQTQGWKSVGSAARHHLPTLTWHGIPLEIHTRLMPAFWGLPEQDMLAARLPLGPPSFKCIDRLRPEAFVLHTCVHLTKHLFEGGFKAAYDVDWSLRQQPLDGRVLAGLIEKSRLPLAAWIPLLFFRDALGLPIPGEVFARAPGGRRVWLLTKWLEAQFFRSCGSAHERNLFLRSGLNLLLHSDVRSVLGSLVMLVRERSPQSAGSGQGRSWKEQFREAYEVARRVWRSRRR